MVPPGCRVLAISINYEGRAYRRGGKPRDEVMERCTPEADTSWTQRSGFPHDLPFSMGAHGQCLR